MKSLNTLLGAAFGSSLLLFGACADSVGGPAPTTASDVQLQHVTMALSNDTSASATAHVMIWASADGSLAYDNMIDLAASASIELDFDLESGTHIADIEVMNDDGVTLEGSGTAEFDVDFGEDLNIMISLGGSLSADVGANGDGEGDGSASVDVGAEAGVGVGIDASGSSDDGDGSASADVDAEAGVGVGVDASGSSDDGDGEGSASADVDAEVGVGVSASGSSDDGDDDEGDDDGGDAEGSVTVTIHIGLGLGLGD
ncbi:MAG: hypothetical protein H6745_08745 [Deltaproteobacteria bacterium]|nr:hypothetical protein [Deltaproteobacteria bacterium]